MELVPDTAAPVSGAQPTDPTPGAQAAPGGDAPGASGGAAPLTPYQRRKEKERRSAAEAAARKAKREAAKAGKAGGKSEPAQKSTDAADDDRDDAQRERETGGAWRLTLRIVGLLAYPFGYRLDPLTDKEVGEDVKLLAPLARRHLWLDVAIRYAALPYLLVERVVTKLKKREPEKAKEPTK